MTPLFGRRLLGDGAGESVRVAAEQRMGKQDVHPRLPIPLQFPRRSDANQILLGIQGEVEFAQHPAQCNTERQSLRLAGYFDIGTQRRFVKSLLVDVKEDTRLLRELSEKVVELHVLHVEVDRSI